MTKSRIAIIWISAFAIMVAALIAVIVVHAINADIISDYAEAGPEYIPRVDRCYPVDNMDISSGFGYRMDPLGGPGERLHKGVDIARPIGTPVRAVRAGYVVEYWPPPNGYYGGDPTYGGKVTIMHDDGTYTIYGHLSAGYVREDRRVVAGQVIGAVGNTGMSTGPHLHYERVVDPLSYCE